MTRLIFVIIFMSVQLTLERFVYEQPFIGVPAEACVGGEVNFTCEIRRINIENVSIIRNAVFTRNDIVINDATANHTLLTTIDENAVGFSVSNITLDDNGTEYTCTDTSAPDNFRTTLILNVTGAPTIGAITVAEGCTYLYFTWMYNSNACGVVIYNVTLKSSTMEMKNTTTMNSLNFTELPASTSFNVTIQGSNMAGTGSDTISVTTLLIEGPDAPDLVRIDTNLNGSSLLVTVSWQAPPIIDDCTANITLYVITIMDQYGSVTQTVLGNVMSVAFSNIAPNRENSIFITAISEQGLRNQSGPYNTSTYILQNCEATSSNVGTIIISCDLIYFDQIQVNLTCSSTIVCINRTVIKNGNSPLSVPNLDPGMMYDVAINAFDGNQVVFSNLTVVIQNVTVIRNNQSELPTNQTKNDDGDDDDNSTTIIIIVVILIIVAIVVVIITIVLLYWYRNHNKDSTDKSDKQELKSPTSTGGSHTASVKPSNVPHQVATSGEEYALTTKVNTTTKPPQQPTEEYAMVDKNKKHAAVTQGIHYADLQALPSSGSKPPANQGPTATYAQVA